LTFEISKKIEEEQQLLDEVHELLSKYIHIANLRYQLSNPNLNKSQSLKTILAWRLEKYEKV
jgi:hypothetical protein